MLDIKNIDISLWLCSGSYPYTLCFNKFKISCFCTLWSYGKTSFRKTYF